MREISFPVDSSISSTIDLERSQGALFRWITAHKSQVAEVVIPYRIPRTCHFANIVNTLGVELVTPNAGE